MEENEMGGACGINGEEKNAYSDLVGEQLTTWKTEA
jgi:hypothetical protein